MSNFRDNIIKEYLEGVQKFYPSLDFGSLFSLYSGDEPTSGKFEFSNVSKALQESHYGEITSKYFIHYTSIDSFLSIFNSAELRLYNLYKQEDPNEFKYAVNSLEIPFQKDEVELFQRSLFITSLNAYTFQDDELDMWRLYGNKGKGIGIVFHIENGESSWHDAFFGKVFYGSNNKSYQLLQNYITFHNEFQKMHRALEALPTFISLLALLHKSEIYTRENEYRLMSICKFDKFEYSIHHDYTSTLSQTLNHTLTNDGIKTAYLSLPLNLIEQRKFCIERLGEEDGEMYFSWLPQFKINHALLGYNVSESLWHNLSELVEFNGNKKLGYSFPIYYSQLRKEFQI